VVLCALTSNLANAAYSVLVNPADVEGTMPVPSRVKVSKVLSIQQALVRKRLGRIKPAVMRQVWKEFQSLFPI
jgi:mRNA-degrading endonuclease toxin of MazEF toxin-antitoxin module